MQLYLTFHSYGQYILYPWGYDALDTPDWEDLNRVSTGKPQGFTGTSTIFLPLCFLMNRNKWALETHHKFG
jgi:hypothetical protein